MMEDNELKNKRSDLKSKLVLLPDRLKSGVKGNVIQSISMLVHQIKLSLQQSEDLSTFQRIIKVLIRGIGSSNTLVQKNYFLALEIIIITYKTSPWFSLKYILDAVEAELHISKSTPKRDKCEILLGRVLVFGVLVRSGALLTATVDEQESVLTHLLQDMKGKSHLPLIADPFLIQYLKEINKTSMKKVVWPLLQNEVSPGPKQSLVIYHMLLVAEERFPSVVSTSYLQQTLGVSQVLSTATMPGLLTALQANFKLNSCNHPLYNDIFKYLTSAEDSVLQCFWEQVDTQLLVESSLATNKHIMGIKFFSLIVSQMENSSQIPGLLTPKLVSWFLRKHKAKEELLQTIFSEVCKEAFRNLCNLCSKPESTKSVVSVIKKLMFEQGNVLCEHGSGIKLMQQLSTHLTEKGVMKLATKLRPVITNSCSAVDLKEPAGSKRPWHNVERLHATQFFCNLLALPVVRANSEWRLEQLTFLFDMGFFRASVGVELAGHIRENFYSCLYHKLPSLVDLRNLLAGIVKHINTRLDNGDELRIKVSAEVLKDWKKMFMTAEQVDKEKKYQNEQWMTSVFQTMFYHIGLHLFKEPAFATDCLEELHSVCKRVSGVKVENEPHWTEVVVEMILSLLSRNSHLHRHLIGCIFSHFCPLMTPQNIYQILQVLDPSHSSNPLLSSLDTDSESSSDEESVDGNNDEGEEEMESSDDGMSDDTEEEEIDEKANDKLRRAVFEALGDNGALTDVESVDLDEMDEAEAVRVDMALSEAFRANRQAKSKKPAPHAKALTNFRIRVLDLVEVWASSEPPLDLMVDTILALITLLEHALVDRFQAPLEVRVRSVIRKLTSIKKYNVSDCKSLKLGNILKSLLEKGNRTTNVYMSIVKELSACTVFIVKASQHVPEAKDEDDPTQVTMLKVLKETVDNYFQQRDCLLPVDLYRQLFQQNVPYIIKLANKLPNYVFDPSVHPFRRSKALEFLIVFFKTNRTLSEASDKCVDRLRKMSTHLYNESIKMMEEPANKIKPNFVVTLKQAFKIIKKNKWMPEVDWEQHSENLAKFQKTYITKKEKKGKMDKINNTKMDFENDAADTNNTNNEDTTDDENLDESQTRKSSEECKLDEDELSDEEERREDQRKTIGNLNKSKKSQGITSKKKAPKKQTSNISQENGDLSNEELQATSNSNKKSDRKKNQNRTKRTQLLKKNSKKLRLASMTEGLDDNLFSNYKLLDNNTTLQASEM